MDTNAPLSLFNSLTHLTYLTSTSPRIREIMTMDGGLERLVKLLHDFCMCPPPPENAAILYGLSPPAAHPPKLVPTLNPKSFDKHHRVVFSHGDLHINNILVHNGRLSGLIDWECAGWYPEYWDYTIAIYHIRKLPFWVEPMNRIFPQYEDELEVEREMWKVNTPW